MRIVIQLLTSWRLSIETAHRSLYAEKEKWGALHWGRVENLKNQIKCKRHSLKGDVTWPSRVPRITHPKRRDKVWKLKTQQYVEGTLLLKNTTTDTNTTITTPATTLTSVVSWRLALFKGYYLQNISVIIQSRRFSPFIFWFTFQIFYPSAAFKKFTCPRRISLIFYARKSDTHVQLYRVKSTSRCYKILK